MPESLPQPGVSLDTGIMPAAPGKILGTHIAMMGFGIQAAALQMELNVQDLQAILDGSKRVDATMAETIGRFTSMSPKSWENMQAAYDLSQMPSR